MRKPIVENKYNLKPKDIERAIILDREKIQQPPFWRNNVINAWCLTKGVGKGYYEPISELWIGFYDETASAYKGKIRMSCTTYEGMCHYKFNSFFDYTEIDNEVDLMLQEELLRTYNWLIDDKIIEIPRKDK